MILISSLLGCRNCLKTDGMRYMYTLMDGNLNDYQMKTEFEVMTLIENFRNKNNTVCEFCGSSNVEVYNIEVGNQPLYDFEKVVERYEKKNQSEIERLDELNGNFDDICRKINYINERHIFVLSFDVDKYGSEINLTTNSNVRHVLKSFYKDVIYKIISTINERPIDNFIEQIIGTFSICISGECTLPFVPYKTISVQVERFQNSGLSREEILRTIKPLADEFGVHINVTNQNNLTNSNPLSNKVFKGSIFSSWIYMSKEEKDRGYPFACASFNLDEKTIIAIGTAYDETPREFIDKNQQNTFIIDDSIPPLFKNEKIIYFSKRVGKDLTNYN